MRILLLGQQIFREELGRLGHEVITAGTASDREIVLASADFSVPNIFDRLGPARRPDLCLIIEELGLRIFPRGIEHTPCPLVFYSIDTHLNNFWLERFAPVCDGVLTTQRDYVSSLERCGVPAHWLPWSYHPAEYRNLGTARDLDIVFVGTVDAVRARRRNLLDLLAGHHRVSIHSATPDRRFTPAEISALFSRARIVVNEAICNEVNFRVFEALATGAMLLTERVGNGLPESFVDGRELVTFTPFDLLAKADHYLRNEDERSAIAAAGQQAVQARHNREVRAAELAAILEEVDVRRPGARALPGRSYFFLLRRGLMPAEPYVAETERLLEAACQPGPDAGAAFLDLGEFRAACGMTAAAASCYAESWRQGERGFRLAALWGLRLLADGAPDDARTLFAHILTLDIPPDLRLGLQGALEGALPSAELYLWLGRIAEVSGGRFQAGFIPGGLTPVPITGVDYLLLGLEIDPGHREICLALADIYRQNGCRYFATSYYLRALEADDYRSAELHYRAAFALADIFRIEDALLLVCAAWEEEPHPCYLDLIRQLQAAEYHNGEKSPATVV